MKPDPNTSPPPHLDDYQHCQHVGGSLSAPSVPAPTLCRFWTVPEAVAAGLVRVMA